MLPRTFIHLPRVGPITERRLWQAGLASWAHLLDHQGALPGFSSSRWAELQACAAQSQRALETGDHCFFARALAPREHWRAFSTFGRRPAYVDIETTGMGPWAEVTVVGIWDGSRASTFVAGDNMDECGEVLADQSFLVTYNGAAFDLPILRRRFPGLPPDQLHVDLRYALARLGLRGGLKVVERRLGLDRDDDLAGLDGWDAVRLWYEYRRGDDAALDLLVRYNAADVRNLEPLMGYAYARLRAGLLGEAEAP